MKINVIAMLIVIILLQDLTGRLHNSNYEKSNLYFIPLSAFICRMQAKNEIFGSLNRNRRGTHDSLSGFVKI